MENYNFIELLGGMVLVIILFYVVATATEAFIEPHLRKWFGLNKKDKEKTALNMVKEFQETFDNPILDKPTIPEGRWKLKVALIQEELNELEAACKVEDKVEVLDALVDLQYVLNGAILEFGMQHIFDKAFKDVHESNLTKACATIHEVSKTQKHYEKLGVDTDFFLHRGVYIVYRVSDDKTLKSVDYQPVNLSKYV